MLPIAGVTWFIPRGRTVVHYTAWLPETYAVAGEIVRLRQGDGSWGEPKRVESVGPWTLSESLMRKAGRAHLKQRIASNVGRGS